MSSRFADGITLLNMALKFRSIVSKINVDKITDSDSAYHGLEALIRIQDIQSLAAQDAYNVLDNISGNELLVEPFIPGKPNILRPRSDIDLPETGVLFKQYPAGTIDNMKNSLIQIGCFVAVSELGSKTIFSQSLAPFLPNSRAIDIRTLIAYLCKTYQFCFDSLIGFNTSDHTPYEIVSRIEGPDYARRVFDTKSPLTNLELLDAMENLAFLHGPISKVLIHPTADYLLRLKGIVLEEYRLWSPIDYHDMFFKRVIIGRDCDRNPRLSNKDEVIFDRKYRYVGKSSAVREFCESMTNFIDKEIVNRESTLPKELREVILHGDLVLDNLVDGTLIDLANSNLGNPLLDIATLLVSQYSLGRCMDGSFLEQSEVNSYLQALSSLSSESLSLTDSMKEEIDRYKILIALLYVFSYSGRGAIRSSQRCYEVFNRMIDRYPRYETERKLFKAAISDQREKFPHLIAL